MLLTLPARAQAPADAPPEGGTLTGAPGKGITLTSADEALSLTLRSRIQLRDTVQIDDAGDVTHQAQVKTLRIYFQGHAYDPDFKYTIQLAFGGNDFEPGSSSPIFDAFVEYVGVRDANVRLGQYFVPFDRARTVREFALQLVDRQRPVQELTLDRDVGVAVTSEDLFGLGGRLGYAAGVFGGDGRNRFDGTEPGFLYVGRLYTKPFGGFEDNVEADIERKPEPRLMVGVAAAYNQNTDRVRSTTGDRLTLGTVDYLNLAADTVFKFSGFSLLAEVLYRKASRDRFDGVDDAGEPITEFSRSGWGWFAQAGMMLTDHLEVAGRYAELHAFDDTDPSFIDTAETRGHELVGGLSYYFNGHFLKAQADYTRLFGDSFSEGDHVIRTQFDATF